MTNLQKMLQPGTELHEKLKLVATDQKHTYLALNLSTNESQVFIAAHEPKYFKDPKVRATMHNQFRCTVLYAGHVAPVNLTPKLLQETPIDQLQKVIEDAITKVAKLGLKPNEDKPADNDNSGGGQSNVDGQGENVSGTKTITSNLPES
jgi:hypothetical protein